jgi:hypothetical protein
MSSVERIVPVPGMSPGGFTVFSRFSALGFLRMLCMAVRAGKVRASDLPEMIANVSDII